MLQPKTLTIDGTTFQINPMPLLKAMKMDKRVLQILAPVVSGIDFKALSKDGLDADFGSIGIGLQKALESLPDADFTRFISDMVSNVTYIGSNGAEVLDNDQALETAFAGNILGVYQLIYEVAKYNKFTPFAVANLGQKLKGMFISK